MVLSTLRKSTVFQKRTKTCIVLWKKKVAHYVQKTVQAHFQPMVSDYKFCIQIPLVFKYKWDAVIGVGTLWQK